MVGGAREEGWGGWVEREIAEGERKRRADGVMVVVVLS